MQYVKEHFSYFSSKNYKIVIKYIALNRRVLLNPDIGGSRRSEDYLLCAVNFHQGSFSNNLLNVLSKNNEADIIIIDIVYADL